MSEQAPVPFRRLSAVLRERYGEKVYKVVLRGPFSCPHRDRNRNRGADGCVFCNEAATEPLASGDGADIAEQLRRGMAHIRARYGARKFIAYFNNDSATHAPAAVLRDCCAPALDVPEVVGLALGTRPDCVTSEALVLLTEMQTSKDLWLELGLQLADDALLGEMNRQHSVADFITAVRSCHARNIPVCAHVIIGYPGATRATEAHTAELLAELGVWGVKLHAFHVLTETETARRWQRGTLSLLSREAHAERVIDFLERLPPEMVIHRVTAEAPRCFTLAPAWTINKMASFDAVLTAAAARNSWQGRCYDAHESQSRPPA